MTPQEINSLKTYSELRDNLLKEVGDAQKAKDILLQENKTLASSNSDIQNEIALGTQKLEFIRSSVKSEGESAEREKVSLHNEISAIQEQRTSLKAEVATLDELFNKNKTSLETLQSVSEGIKVDLLSIKGNVKIDADVVKDTVAVLEEMTTTLRTNLDGIFADIAKTAEEYGSKNVKLNLDKKQHDQKKEVVDRLFVKIKEDLDIKKSK